MKTFNFDNNFKFVLISIFFVFTNNLFCLDKKENTGQGSIEKNYTELKQLIDKYFEIELADKDNDEIAKHALRVQRHYYELIFLDKIEAVFTTDEISKLTLYDDLGKAKNDELVIKFFNACRFIVKNHGLQNWIDAAKFSKEKEDKIFEEQCKIKPNEKDVETLVDLIFLDIKRLRIKLKDEEIIKKIYIDKIKSKFGKVHVEILIDAAKKEKETDLEQKLRKKLVKELNLDEYLAPLF